MATAGPYLIIFSCGVMLAPLGKLILQLLYVYLQTACIQVLQEQLYILNRQVQHAVPETPDGAVRDCKRINIKVANHDIITRNLWPGQVHAGTQHTKAS